MDEAQSAGGPWANARAGRRSAKGRSCEGRLTKGGSQMKSCDGRLTKGETTELEGVQNVGTN